MKLPNLNLTKKLLGESLFVGLYTCVIYFFVSYVVSFRLIFLLFVVGFLKHFLGYYLKIQDYYCGSCVKGSKSHTTKQILLGESILEGGVFIIIGFLLGVFIGNRVVLMFLVGFLLHMIAEFVGLHKYFCKNRCLIQRRP
jgi:hypothetical protein